MAGYGYKAPDDLGIIDWASVAKGMSDMLNTENERREKLKAQYEKQYTDEMNKLQNAPMGQYKDANDFTSRYVESMTKQRLIDYRLFKSGQLNEKDYILKSNNAMNSTNTMFDLQKKYQEQAKPLLEGISSGKYQQVTAFNMKNIEAFGDFSKTTPIINPKTNEVNLAKLKFNEKTGQMEMTNEIMPVGTAMRLMSTPIETYDIDGAMDADVASMGTLTDAVFDAATTSGAGSITKFTGPEAFKTYPESAEIIKKFNDAIDNNVNKQLSSNYRLMSVLTQNTNKYDAESYTMDMEEAKKDENKILLKIDPNTGLTTLDEKAPNYEKQKKEAFDWVRTQMMARIKRSKEVVNIPREQKDQPSGYEIQRQTTRESAGPIGQKLADFITGDDATAKASQAYFLQQDINLSKDKSGNIIAINPEGTKSTFPADTPVNTLIESLTGVVRSLIGTNQLNENDVINAGKRRARGKSVSKAEIPPQYEAPVTTTEVSPIELYNNEITKRINSNVDLFKEEEGDAIQGIKDIVEDFGFTAAEAVEGQDYIDITSPSGVTKRFSFDENEDNAVKESDRMIKWMILQGQSEAANTKIEEAVGAGILKAPAGSTLNATKRKQKEGG